MAYMNQEKKKLIVEHIKPILKAYKMKGTLSIRNHSTIVLTLSEGKLELLRNYCATYEPRHNLLSNGQSLGEIGYLRVNPYYLREYHSGVCLEFLEKITAAMNIGNHDRSDIMTDYFDVGWYVDINIGTYKKTYKVLD